MAQEHESRLEPQGSGRRRLPEVTNLAVDTFEHRQRTSRFQHLGHGARPVVHTGLVCDSSSAPDVWLDALFQAHIAEGIDWIDGLGLREQRRQGIVATLKGLAKGRWWSPCPASQSLLLLPCYEPLDGTVVDVMAIDPDKDDRHHLLTGLCVMLGEPPFLDEVRLHRTPMDWLAANGDGICIHDWEEARRFLTGTPPLRLICHDLEHVKEVRTRLWLVMPRLCLEAP